MGSTKQGLAVVLESMHSTVVIGNCHRCEGDGVVPVKRGEGSDSVEERPCPACRGMDPRESHAAALLMIADLNRELADLRAEPRYTLTAKGRELLEQSKK